MDRVDLWRSAFIVGIILELMSLSLLGTLIYFYVPDILYIIVANSILTFVLTVTVIICGKELSNALKQSKKERLLVNG